MHVKIKKGLDLRLGATPESRIAGTKSSSSAAVLGRDFPGVKFEVLVDVGARVAAGEPMLRDRHRTDIVFAAPLSGTIAAVNRGARRALLSIQVVADGGDGETAESPIPAVLDKDAFFLCTEDIDFGNILNVKELVSGIICDVFQLVLASVLERDTRRRPRKVAHRL